MADSPYPTGPTYRCSQVWGGHCSQRVHPPFFTHGYRHPTPAVVSGRCRGKEIPLEVIECWVNISPDDVMYRTKIRSWLFEALTDPDSDTLRIVASSADPTIRYLVAGHPDATTETMMGLVDDDNLEVKLRLAQNARAPDCVLAELARCNDDSIRKTLSLNPKLPEHIRRMLTVALDD